MTKDEALKLALEALEHEAQRGNDNAYQSERKAIKEALAQPKERYTYGTPLLNVFTKPAPVQEPVARVIDDGTPEGATEWIPFTNRVEPLKTGDLLYTTPPAAHQAPVQEPKKFDLNDSFERDEAARNIVREFMRNH